MTVIDLHPEELLDKAAHGELSDLERARLDAHLARCSACRAEQLLRADFAAELDGEDRPSAVLGLVQGALAAPRAAEPATSSPPVIAAPPVPLAAPPAPRAPDTAETSSDLAAVPSLRRRPRRTAVYLLVAAAVLAASAAGATGMTARVWQSLRGPAQELSHASGTSTAAVAATATATATAVSAASPAPSPATEPGGPMNDAPAPTAEAAPSAPPVALTPAVAHVPMAAPAPSHASVPAAAVVPVSAVVPSAIASASASDLFDSANTARRSGDTAGALARYDALDRQFPNSREARVAKATTGRLLLDRGDAAGALARFDAYLASGSSELREEAMAGRATALERLGRDEDESRAWAALLATYPRTPYAAHARARVGRSLP